MNRFAADIGNTNTVLAFMDDTDVVDSVAVSSHATRNETSTILEQFVGDRKAPLFIASVAPRGLDTLEACWTFSDITVFGRDATVPVPNHTRAPDKVGQDRLVNALAASTISKHAIVVDFGTAITFDVVMDSAYEGGVIAPGVGLAMNALHQNTALLPLVDPQMQPDVIGKDTVTAIHSGVFWGYLGLVEKILSKLLEQYPNHPTVLATGGYAGGIAAHVQGIERVDKWLTHRGIALAAKGLMNS